LITRLARSKAFESTSYGELKLAEETIAQAPGQPEPVTPAVEPDPQAKLQSDLETLQAERDAAVAELAQQKDQYLRKAADLENSRKRLVRDKEEAVQFANRNLLYDLVGIIDDFERAIKSSEATKDFETLHNGVQMIEKQFVNLLERKYGLSRFDSAGQEFDPSRHEAVAMEDRADHQVSIVLEDYQKGYILNERVLRTAKVKVSNPPAAATSSELKTE
jgi:molecular chaperone GrpE